MTSDSPLNPGTRIMLSAMMFLQFFIWGAWYVTMGTYLSKLGFSGLNIGNAYSTTAWAALLSPFLVGFLADSVFGSKKMMALLHLAGAALLYAVSRLTGPGAFFWVLILYTLAYMPTLALANTVAMSQMGNPGKDFPSVRVWGTIGWIAAGWMVALLKVEDQSTPFLIGAVASALLGLLCFALPEAAQPARKEAGAEKGLGLSQALTLFRDKSFAVFAIASLLICIPLAFYYSFTNLFLNETGMQNAAGKMTFGQVSEIGFMVLLPFFLKRFGIKVILLTGMLFWAIRYGIFMNADGSHLVWLTMIGIAVHGICYDFLFVTGQIYVDQKAPPHLRASGQGFIAMITYGLGMLIGSWASGAVVQKYTAVNAGAAHDWAAIWKIPALMALAVGALFALLFREKIKGIGK